MAPGRPARRSGCCCWLARARGSRARHRRAIRSGRSGGLSAASCRLRPSRSSHAPWRCSLPPIGAITCSARLTRCSPRGPWCSAIATYCLRSPTRRYPAFRGPWSPRPMPTSAARTLTLFFSLPVQVAAQRRAERASTVEIYDADSVQQRVAAAYEREARALHAAGEPVVFIDASRTREEVELRSGAPPGLRRSVPRPLGTPPAFSPYSARPFLWCTSSFWTFSRSWLVSRSSRVRARI